MESKKSTFNFNRTFLTISAVQLESISLIFHHWFTGNMCDNLMPLHDFSLTFLKRKFFPRLAFSRHLLLSAHSTEEKSGFRWSWRSWCTYQSVCWQRWILSAFLTVLALARFSFFHVQDFFVVFLVILIFFYISWGCRGRWGCYGKKEWDIDYIFYFLGLAGVF